MAGQHRVKFLPSDRVFLAEEGESLLELAMKSGIHINASCGGNGAFGKCRIKVLEGAVRSTPHPKIPQWDYESGTRLACMTTALGDVVVDIPFESQVDR